MIESYQQTIEEFKRLDHLFYVTLKYTRTVDVIRSTVERVISTYEHAITTLLHTLKEDKKISDIPGNPVQSAMLLKEHLGESEFMSNIDTYLKLRRVMRQPYERREEYRRHVTMIVDFEGETMDIDIDLLKVYLDEISEFLRHVKSEVIARNP